MRKFEFRLQNILEYRRMCEEWAKQEYVQAQARLLSGQAELEGIRDRRRVTLESRPDRVDQMIALESFLTRLDDEERAFHAGLSILEQEVESTRTHWLEARQEAEAMQKLRDQAYEAWQVEAAREEQAEMDEYALRRRAA